MPRLETFAVCPACAGHGFKKPHRSKLAKLKAAERAAALAGLAQDTELCPQCAGSGEIIVYESRLPK